MWSRLSLVAFIVCAFAVSVSALQDGDFTYIDNGADITITGYTGSGGVVTIPDTINDKPVASIGNSAFLNCSSLTGITIPDGVTSIGYSSFENCTSLAGITIPDNVSSIGSWAFYYCSGLASITIGNSVTSIGYRALSYCTGLTAITVNASNSVYSSVDGILFSKNQTTLITYPRGKAAVSYTIPGSVTDIGDWAFDSCTGLTDVTIPDSVASIGNWAFYHCNGLTGITIGNSITIIGKSAFSFCTGLTAITVNASNSVYSSEDGGMFNKDKTTLIQCPGGKAGSYTIPSSVTSILNGAFSGCTDLTGVTIPGSVTSIENAAFFGGTGITSALFLGNVPGMGVHVFDLCAPNFTVYYLEGANGFTSPTWEDYPSAIAYTVTYDAEGGSVSPANKAVICNAAYGTLATPMRTAYSFVGWWTGDNGTGTQIAETTTVSNATNHTLYAKWIINPLVIGEAFEISLPATFAGVPRVTVMGLPAGLKYNALTQTITGVPAKAGISNVVISATGVPTQTLKIDVVALPSWAYGSFNGYIDGGEYSGTASMTVTAQGKITGKLALWGKNYAFSAASYAVGGSSADGFSFTVNVGNEFLPMTLRVSQSTELALQTLGVAVGQLSDCSNILKLPVTMYRNVWKDTGMDAILEPFIGYYTAVLPGNADYGSGYLAITVDKTGGVKTTGKLADGTAVSLSSTLILNENEPACVFTVVYTSPATYKTACLFGLVEFVKPEVGDHVILSLLNGVPFIWNNLNPQATVDYYSDMGFRRTLGLSGGWYDKIESLNEYYVEYYLGKDLSFSTDAGTADPELAVLGTHYTSAWWNFSGIELTPFFSREGVMNGFTTPKANSPVKVNGEWDYTADNTLGLNFRLTRASGIFKGSFKTWFDYDKTHTSKSVSYEGVLIPERENKEDGVEGRGFFLWPDKGQYEKLPGKTVTYPFNCSYDFLVQSEE